MPRFKVSLKATRITKSTKAQVHSVLLMRCKSYPKYRVSVPGYIVGKTTWMVYISESLRREVRTLQMAAQYLKLFSQVFETMLPILEKWASVGLTESAVYGIHLQYHARWLLDFSGIRKYTEGSTLQVHVDAKGTHIISAILHVAEEYNSDKDEKWPLQIQDHQGDFFSLFPLVNCGANTMLLQQKYMKFCLSLVKWCCMRAQNLYMVALRVSRGRPIGIFSAIFVQQIMNIWSFS